MRRVYFLSVEKLKEQEVLERLLDRVGEERRKRVLACARLEDQARSLGAGLLLEYGVADCKGNGSGSDACLWVPVTLEEIQATSFSSPHLEFRYGPLGKPYLTNSPLFFSLSHSGSYAVCAISDREIGADIQKHRKVDTEGMARRFFTEEEAERLRRCGTEEERQALFCLLWTRKESHGKLTGRGVAELLAGRGEGEIFAGRRTSDGLAGKEDGEILAGRRTSDGLAGEGAAQCVRYVSYGGLPGYEITVCWYR